MEKAKKKRVWGLAVIDKKSNRRYFIPDSELGKYEVREADVLGQNADGGYSIDWEGVLKSMRASSELALTMACSTEVECVAPSPSRRRG